MRSISLQPEKLVPLASLVHHRWTLPVLNELYRDDGAKFVTLVHRLGISRDSLSRTLEHLKTLDLAVKNPGYGHPLRPEYVLTPTGQVLGSSVVGLLECGKQLGLLDVMLKKWSLPVIWAVHHGPERHGPERFSDLLATLPDVTNRALSLTLHDLDQAGLLERDGNVYRLTERGTALAVQLKALIEALPDDA